MLTLIGGNIASYLVVYHIVRFYKVYASFTMIRHIQAVIIKIYPLTATISLYQRTYTYRIQVHNSFVFHFSTCKPRGFSARIMYHDVIPTTIPNLKCGKGKIKIASDMTCALKAVVFCCFFYVATEDLCLHFKSFVFSKSEANGTMKNSIQLTLNRKAVNYI